MAPCHHEIYFIILFRKSFAQKEGVDAALGVLHHFKSKTQESTIIYKSKPLPVFGHMTFYISLERGDRWVTIRKCNPLKELNL